MSDKTSSPRSAKDKLSTSEYNINEDVTGLTLKEIKKGLIEGKFTLKEEPKLIRVMDSIRGMKDISPLLKHAQKPADLDGLKLCKLSNIETENYQFGISFKAINRILSEQQGIRLKAYQTGLDMLLLEHCYNTTNQNPLFALEAYKLAKDVGWTIKEDDWFMRDHYKLATRMLQIGSEWDRSERTDQAIYRAFIPQIKQKGRSIFTDYRNIKKRLQIHKDIRGMLEKNISRRIIIVDVAEKYGLSTERIENIYRQEEKVWKQYPEDFAINRKPRKV